MQIPRRVIKCVQRRAPFKCNNTLRRQQLLLLQDDDGPPIKKTLPCDVCGVLLRARPPRPPRSGDGGASPIPIHDGNLPALLRYTGEALMYADRATVVAAAVAAAAFAVAATAATFVAGKSIASTSATAVSAVTFAVVAAITTILLLLVAR